MKTGMKIYTAALLLLVGAILFNGLWVPANVRALNQQLASDAYLAAYPYQFRVLSIEGSTATMSTPRSALVPVPLMIHAVAPQLGSFSLSDETYLTAQQELADHQSHAAQIIIADDAIQRIDWQLDRAWLKANGVQWRE